MKRNRDRSNVRELNLLLKYYILTDIAMNLGNKYKRDNSRTTLAGM